MLICRLYIFLAKVSVKVFVPPFFYQVVFLMLNYTVAKSPLQICLLSKYFLPVCGLSSHHLDIVFQNRIWFFCLFFFLAVPGLSCNMQDLQLWHANSQLWHVGSNSLTRDRTWAPCIGSAESQPLDHQGSPRIKVLNFNKVQLINYFFHRSCL